MPYDPKAKANYREKFNNAGKIQDANGNWVRDPSLTDAQIAEKKLEVVRELVGILKDIDAEMQRRADADPRGTYRNQWNKVINRRRATSRVYYNLTQADIIIRRGDGTVHDLTQGEPLKNIPLSSYNRIRDGNIAGSPKYGGIEGLLHSENIKTMMDDVLKVYEDSGSTYETRDGRTLTRDEAIDHMFSSFVGNTASWYNRSKPWTDSHGDVHYGMTDGDWRFYHGTSKFFEALTRGVFDPLNDAPIPLPGAPITFTQPGFLLKHDVIPKMEGAGFFKVRHQIGDHLGLELWALHSFGRGAEVKGEELRIASVLGLGSRLRLGPRAMLSFDCGVNRSDMGRYFHGGRDAAGRYTGGGTNPYFWILRLDYGIADMDLPGTWGAYFDYKNFEHGSFVGGTGADLPDRYLDGIRSFTAGISFVPAKNLLLEAAYTFGARSTQTRDTLYTPEHFRLGDYARFQLTYRF